MVAIGFSGRQQHAFIQRVRIAVRTGKLPPVFTRAEILSLGIRDANHNLPNYDLKNAGANNARVLVSRKIRGKIYYAFAEKLMPLA